MTLWVKKPGLILGLALLIFACEEPGEIGLDINPENGAFVAKYQELFLDNSVLLYEEILADNKTRIDSTEQYFAPGRLLTGSFSNNDFGKMQSKAFAGLYLAPDTMIFSNEDGAYVFDSLILKMKVDYLYGNDIAGQKRIAVHELTDSLELDKMYLTNNTTAYSAEPLGEFVFDFSSFDTVRVDTVMKVHLSDELGLRFLEEAKQNDTTFTNNNLFRDFFYGLAFVSSETNEVVTGMIAESQSSYLRLHFHNATDTLKKDFMFFDLDTIPGNTTRYYNNITLDRIGSPLEGITEYYKEYDTNDDNSYLQASTGVFTKLDMSKYLSFIDTIGFLVINRAELEIPVASYNKRNYPSSALDMYVVDENNRFKEEFVNGRPSPVYEVFPGPKLEFRKDNDEFKGVYLADVTDYIQSLIDDEDPELEFLLGHTSLWNSIASVNQVVIEKDSISLKVYYSTLQNY